jgi:hypothetical protein
VRGNHTTRIVVLMETLQSLLATPRCFGGDRKAMDIAWKALELGVKHSGPQAHHRIAFGEWLRPRFNQIVPAVLFRGLSCLA